ncbi:hypothetical protein AVEN_101538-1 [Araneus ventricosus]|uniref:Uncharacterized protein n=1 Tax=Araneus ventricosus TaxID=182803 RepID=A0A4Y2GUR8_ARAVE|nr:hypothetical protein AVEN_101538-1 [Araneus ventricosus]
MQEYSIQPLANWHRVRDNAGMHILNKLKSLSVSYRIHLQWILSHVNIQSNDFADALAKAGADDASVPSAPLTYLELFSRAKSRNKTIWPIPPVHHWYQGSRLVLVALVVLCNLLARDYLCLYSNQFVFVLAQNLYNN